MKKLFKITVLSLFVAALFMSLTACADPALKEVAGTYEMSYISGSVSGMSISKSNYEYFRLILDEKGNGTVQSKARGGAAYEAKGKYTYKDGKIRLTSKNGSASVTEEYDYEDGVITYTVNAQGMNFTVKFTRAGSED